MVPGATRSCSVLLAPCSALLTKNQLVARPSASPATRVMSPNMSLSTVMGDLSGDGGTTSWSATRSSSSFHHSKAPPAVPA